MVSHNTKQVLYFLIGVWAIISVSKCQVVETTMDRADKTMTAKRSLYKTEVLPEEFEYFVKCWPEFSKLGLSGEVHFSEETLKEKLNWKMRIWFAYRYWDANRFFYVRKRLLSLLDEIKVRREALNIIAQLKGRKEDDKALQMINLQMIDLQRKRIKSLQITSGELKILLPREGELREMFKQYP